MCKSLSQTLFHVFSLHFMSADDICRANNLHAINPILLSSHNYEFEEAIGHNDGLSKVYNTIE